MNAKSFPLQNFYLSIKKKRKKNLRMRFTLTLTDLVVDKVMARTLALEDKPFIFF